MLFRSSPRGESALIGQSSKFGLIVHRLSPALQSGKPQFFYFLHYGRLHGQLCTPSHTASPYHLYGLALLASQNSSSGPTEFSHPSRPFSGLNPTRSQKPFCRRADHLGPLSSDADVKGRCMRPLLSAVIGFRSLKAEAFTSRAPWQVKWDRNQ